MATSESMSDLLGAGGAATASGGFGGQAMQQGVQLAQTNLDVQAKMQRQQQMQQQLDDGRLASFYKRTDLAMNAPDSIKKKMFDQLGDWMGKNGMDATIAEGLKDSDFQEKFNRARQLQTDAVNKITNSRAQERVKLLQQLGPQANTAQGFAQIQQHDMLTAQQVAQAKIPTGDQIQALASWEKFQPGVSHIVDTYTKQAEMEQLKQMQVGGQLGSAAIQAQGRVDAQIAGQGPGSPRAVKTQEAVTNDYNRAMKPFEQTYNAVDQLKSTMADIQSGKLSDAKNVKAEIESKMASVFGGGKPSTVYGQQAVGLDSLYGEYQNITNKILGEAHGVLTEAQKAQLMQELKTFGTNAAKQHEDAYLTFAAGRENLPEQYTAGMHKAYSTYRRQKGLSDVNQQGQVQAPMANTMGAKETQVPQGQQAGQLSANQQSFMQKAVLKVNPKTGVPFTQQEAAAIMQQNGIK